MEYTKTLIATLTILLAPFLLAADPDPLQDFCVADLTGGGVTMNGYPCKPTASAGKTFFFSKSLVRGGDTNNPNGSNATESDVKHFPGINTLGVSMNRVDFAPGGTNPPHVHPRGSEIGVVAQGQLLVGIVSTDNVYYSKVLNVGETFVIPRGLMHFQFNVGRGKATQFVSFNSQEPGIIFWPVTLFGTTPPIPTPVLSKAFRVDDDIINLLKSKFAGEHPEWLDTDHEGTIKTSNDDFASELFA